MATLRKDGHRLVWEFDHHKVWMEAWGPDGIRVRANVLGGLQDQPGSLEESGFPTPVLAVDGDQGSLTNGKLTVKVLEHGRLMFTKREGKVLLEERWRNRDSGYQSYESLRDKPRMTYDATLVPGREFRSLGPGFRITQRWEAFDGEKFFGMGQYQDGMFDLKGSLLELAQRNSQVTVPFTVSSRGYGFLWNNPAIGRASFGFNYSEWVAECSQQLDYWVTAGDSPAQILENYTAVTGRPPVMPEFALGFWQCKLRYRSQQELLSVAREHKRRGLPLSVIVADFFHWPMQGDWKFDSRYWPDPRALVDELAELGVRLMVSVWPTVDQRSENFQPMREKGFLVQTERGIRTNFEFMGNTVFFDPTNPAAREFVWSVLKRNYFDVGIREFWLDVAEPEYSVYDFDNYRYHMGTNLAVGNLYPLAYAQTIYEGQAREGNHEVISLVRSAWAGSQKFGALVWSGDIDTTFETLRRQIVAGLHMGLAGISWWNTDIGGFAGGDPDDADYRELLIRWFQFGAFSPVMRLHGFRVDKNPEFALMHSGGDSSDDVFSGGANEVWSYGDEAYAILVAYLNLRERLRPYLGSVMQQAHETGAPVLRTLFFEFPEDSAAWMVSDQFLLGSDILVCPVLELKARQRSVYLPKSSADWRNPWTGEVSPGGQTVLVKAELDTIPIFVRVGAKVASQVWPT